MHLPQLWEYLYRSLLQQLRTKQKYPAIYLPIGYPKHTGRLDRWAHGNKAVTIILMLPVFALATRWAFRKRTYNRHYNFTELVFVQAYTAC